jgi:hypothetical protein
MELWARNGQSIWPLIPTPTQTTGFFYMPQIYDMGQMALLPLRRKPSCGFFWLKNLTASARFEPWVPKGTKGMATLIFNLSILWG